MRPEHIYDNIYQMYIKEIRINPFSCILLLGCKCENVHTGEYSVITISTTKRQQQITFFYSEAQITTLLHMSREKKTLKHGIMTTIIEECQLIFYNYKKLEKLRYREEKIKREKRRATDT